MIHECVTVGDDVRFGAGVQVGADGFGYQWDGERWLQRRHDFGVVIGDNVTVGDNTVIHAGRWRNTVIGEGSKVDALVFVAHNVVIGKHCLLVANSMLAGSVTLGDEVIVGGGASVVVGATVGDRAIIGLGAAVVCDVPAGQVWAGCPARYLRDRRPGETL